MKRILLSFAFIMLIFSSTCIAENAIPSTFEQDDDKAIWEYVLSDDNFMFYVDLNDKHIYLPSKDIIVFRIASLCSRKNFCNISQYAIKNDNHKLYLRKESSEVIDTNTKKVTFHNRNSSLEWEPLESGSTLELCFKRIGKYLHEISSPQIKKYPLAPEQ